MQFSIKTGLTLVGASKFTKLDLKECLKFAPKLVAVDGGANRLRDLKMVPDFVIGDMDSIDRLDYLSEKHTEIIHISEQNSTDFDKSLRTFIGNNLILAVGFLGRRNDHLLSCLSTVLRNPTKKIILLNSYDVIFLMPKKFLVSLPVSTRISLYPFSAVKGIKSSGLKYPIDDISFSPFGVVGVSNQTINERVEIEVNSQKMLIILPRACLRAVLTQIF